MNVAPEKKFLKTWLWKFFAFIYLAKKKKILDLVCWNNRFVIKNLFLSLFVSKNLKNITSE